MTPEQQKVDQVAHWIKYMPMYTAYVIDSIKRHFANCPEDRAIMKPQLDAAYTQLKEARK